MAITGDLEWQFSATPRETRLIYQYLVEANFVIPTGTTSHLDYQIDITNVICATDRHRLIQFINGYFGSISRNYCAASENDSPEKLRQLLCNIANDALLDNSDFSWIKNQDPITTFYVWGLLKSSVLPHVMNFPSLGRQYSGFSFLYSKFTIFTQKVHCYDLCPSSKDDTFNAIVSFFDLLGVNKSSKKSLMDLIRESASVMLKEKHLSWINKDDNKHLSHILSLYEKFNISTWFFDPIPTAFLYECLISSFYICHQDRVARKAYGRELRQLWNSYERRHEANEDSKPYNYIMSVEIEEIMDELKRRFRWNKSEIVEHLIRMEYKNPSHFGAASVEPKEEEKTNPVSPTSSLLL